jgi:hypothetical protein
LCKAALDKADMSLKEEDEATGSEGHLNSLEISQQLEIALHVEGSEMEMSKEVLKQIVLEIQVGRMQAQKVAKILMLTKDPALPPEAR